MIWLFLVASHPLDWQRLRLCHHRALFGIFIPAPALVIVLGNRGD
jgi:hypothetical protein